LVNNAGWGTVGPFWQLPAGREEAMLRVLVLAPVRLAHAVLPGMVASGHGAIVNVSSWGSFQPGPFTATYVAAKAFLTSLSESLHEEVRPLGVHVLALCPGFTRTGFHDAMAAAGTASPPVPDVVWMPAAAVVRQALRDLDRGRAVSVPGALYRTLAALSHMAPRWALRRVSWIVMKGLGADRVTSAAGPG
ncbi:MAG: SDR family NAD(P)-dependent oxidoreductase, partial [Actinomycetota bacterium]